MPVTQIQPLADQQTSHGIWVALASGLSVAASESSSVGRPEGL